MGHVFLARHRTFGRRAAVKVVRPDRTGDERARARFLREVRALGQLDHINVVHAYDAGAVGRAYYLAMEYLPGPDLGQMLQSGETPPLGHACEFARQAALGLHHMHERGLVHRDVKPGNLSLAEDGRTLKVLDVGLVKNPKADTNEELTRAGWLVGTADYAAPEQVVDARTADHRADQYALGATLYHMLVGDLPFPEGTPVARALRRVTEDAPLVSAKRPDVPSAVVDLVARLLARRSEDRFPSSRAAAEALAAFATPLTRSSDETVVSLATYPTLPTIPPGAIAG